MVSNEQVVKFLNIMCLYMPNYERMVERILKFINMLNLPGRRGKLRDYN